MIEAIQPVNFTRVGVCDHTVVCSQTNSIEINPAIIIRNQNSEQVQERLSIIDDLDARNEAYADAEAWLFDNVVQIPLKAGGGMPSVSNIVPFTKPSSYTGLGSSRFKFMKIQDTIVSQEQFNKAYEEYIKG